MIDSFARTVSIKENIFVQGEEEEEEEEDEEDEDDVCGSDEEGKEVVVVVDMIEVKVEDRWSVIYKCTRYSLTKKRRNGQMKRVL